MKNKILNTTLGSLITLFLIIPPSIGKFLGFEYSDLAFIIFIFLISIFIFQKINYEKSDIFWLLLTTPFIFSLLFDGLNFTTIRFIAYIFSGYLFKKYIQYYKDKDLIWILIPIFLVSSLNFLTFLQQQSYLDNTIGWISNYSDTSNIFFTGRLAGFQGSGPNVAGALFGIFTLMNFYIYKLYKNKLSLLFLYLNFLLFLITFSRGSFMAFLIIFIIYIFVNINERKFKVVYFLSLFSFVMLFLYFGPSSLILKENDRSLLANIAFQNINLFEGVGGGDYVEKIYEPYLLSINPSILEEKFKISLNKVELGITPEEYRDTDIDFFIGTSGGGFEILQQYFLSDKCSDDRNTCQYRRIDKSELIEFLKIFVPNDTEKINNAFTSCKQGEGLVTRGEYACIAFNLKILGYDYTQFEFVDISDQIDLTKFFSYIYSNNLFVECESSKKFSCSDRYLSVGELSVVIEKLFISSNVLTENDLINICLECSYRDVDGFIKIKYDRYDYILPRSKVSFFTSTDGINWDIVGYPHFTGEVLKFTENKGLIEIGGHSDGQSFGNTFLDANIKSVEIINKQNTKKIEFKEEYLNKDFYIFKPNTLQNYNSKITFENTGVKLFRPNKYWVAIENEYDFENDFEIIIHLSLPEVPWETQTLISNTSLFAGDSQSWKIDIDDGRIYFKWTNSNGEFNYQLGDKSLRSGVLTQLNGKLANEQSPLVNASFISQLTTAHNGYLTLFVEYGLFFGVLFYLFVIILTFRGFKTHFMKTEITLYLILFFILIHNFTNDLFYSPDIVILFYLVLGFKETRVDLKDFL